MSNKNIVTRDLILSNNAASEFDISARYFVSKNKTKINALCNYIVNTKHSISDCAELAGISRVTYNRIKLSAKKIQEFADNNGYDIVGSEYEDLIEYAALINRAEILTRSVLIDKMYEFIDVDATDDGKVIRKAATIKEIDYIMEVRGLKDENKEDIVDGESEKPQVVINISNSKDILESLESSQKNLEDETKRRADLIIGQLMDK